MQFVSDVPEEQGPHGTFLAVYLKDHVHKFVRSSSRSGLFKFNFNLCLTVYNSTTIYVQKCHVCDMRIFSGRMSKAQRSTVTWDIMCIGNG